MKFVHTAKVASIWGAICVLVLGGILLAGLWPFHAPRNDVTWLAKSTGLRFGKHGTIVSSLAVTQWSKPDGVGCGLEVWLVPGATFGGTLLAFYRRNDPGGFSLHQKDTDLVLENEGWSRKGDARYGGLRVDDVFHQGQPVFITVMSDGHEVRVYANGTLARESRYFTVSAQDLTGRLVVANSPVENDSWSGELRGLAFYSRELTAAQVLRHYQTWTRTGRPDVTKHERAIGLYLFDERSGSIIRNHAGDRVDLYIPERYMEVHEKLLESPWNGYYPGWGYWKNVLMNIGGFVPLGFFFYAYLSLALRARRAALATIVLGVAVSLTIEILQAFLPTRDSGMTDIMTNTLGTAVGVGLCRCASTVCERFMDSNFTVLRYVARLFADGQQDAQEELELSGRL